MIQFFTDNLMMIQKHSKLNMKGLKCVLSQNTQ